MPVELKCLAWAVVLGLAHIFIAAQARTHQYGLKWNAGPRDEQMPPLSPVAGRLQRAQANFFETFPLFAAAALIVALVGRGTGTTAIGAQLYLAARVIYLPLYAFGVPYIRSLAFLAATAGLVMVLWPALFG